MVLLVLAAVTLVAAASSPAPAAPVAPAAPSAPAASAGPVPVVVYRHPVAAPILDRFRAPANPYGPGNRGLDYATAPGVPVLAAAPGEVTFAGQVGGQRHVVVLHADGLRTTYAFLAEVVVRRGERVGARTVVGTTGTTPLHVGLRDGDRYLDPELRFRPFAEPLRARLVPVVAGRFPLGAAGPPR